MAYEYKQKGQIMILNIKRHYDKTKEAYEKW